MSKLQQSIFLNLSRQSSYQSKSRCLSSSTYNYFAKSNPPPIQTEKKKLKINLNSSTSKEQKKYPNMNSSITSHKNTENQIWTNWTTSSAPWTMTTKEKTASKYTRTYGLVLHKISSQRKRTLQRSQPPLLPQTKSRNHPRNLQRNKKNSKHKDTQKPSLYAIINIEKVFIKSERP